MLQFAEDCNMMWLFKVLNVIFIITLAFVDFFYFLGVAKDRKRCTNREWRQGTKGFRNTVTWEGIRKYVPKYLYVHHIITLSVMSLAILSPLFSLMGLYKIWAFAFLLITSWLVFNVCIIAVQGFWADAVSPSNNLFTSILFAIATLFSVALIIFFVYKLLRGIGLLI